jgi:hypothetical protein
VDIIPASALDRHTFGALRAVILVLDAEPDLTLLRRHYGAAVALEPIAPGYAALPPADPYLDLASLATVTRIAERLRSPDGGCPWDREQTHASLRPHLLEEAYETLEALDKFVANFQKKWKDKTECRAGYVTQVCKGAKATPTPSAAGGAVPTATPTQ